MTYDAKFSGASFVREFLHRFPHQTKTVLSARLSNQNPATIILVPSEALCGSSTFDDDDELYTNTMMPLQLPGSMVLLLLWITWFSEFQSNNSVVLPLRARL
jgi:hypothetical protein